MEPLTPTEICLLVFACLVFVFCVISGVAFALREGPVVKVIHPELELVSIREVDPAAWVSRRGPFELTKEGVVRTSDDTLVRPGRFRCFGVTATGVPTVFTNLEYPGAIAIKALSRGKIAATYEDRVEVQEYTYPRGPVEWLDSHHIAILVRDDVIIYDVTTGRRTGSKGVPRPSPVDMSRKDDMLIVHCGRPDWFTTVPQGFEVAFRII